MNEQELNIVVEILEETFGIETTIEKANEFIECLDATRDQMSFVDTRESEIKEVVKEKIDLSLCCEKPIAWRKLSGSLGHGEYYCSCCDRSRKV